MNIGFKLIYVHLKHIIAAWYGKCSLSVKKLPFFQNRYTIFCVHQQWRFDVLMMFSHYNKQVVISLCFLLCAISWWDMILKLFSCAYLLSVYHWWGMCSDIFPSLFGLFLFVAFQEYFACVWYQSFIRWVILKDFLPD